MKFEEKILSKCALVNVSYPPENIAFLLIPLRNTSVGLTFASNNNPPHPPELSARIFL
jgi:hypothetical protein